MLKDCNSLLITCLEIDRFQDPYANFDIVSSMRVGSNYVCKKSFHNLQNLPGSEKD